MANTRKLSHRLVLNSKLLLLSLLTSYNFKYYVHPQILIIIVLQGFLEADEKMRHDESLKDEMSGSTAIMALLR